MKLAGYYAILDVAAGELGAPGLIARVTARADRLLEASPCMLQLRAKEAPPAQLAVLARSILPAARRARVPVCVNDRLDVALAVGAEAVHLGQDDLPLADALPLAEARLRTGSRLLIGVSTHNLTQAGAAVAGGADYIGFGPIFATATKANPDPVVGTAMLRQLAGGVAASVPVVAIGGITLDRLAEIAACGAAAAALIGAIEMAVDPVAAGLAVNLAFSKAPTPSRVR
ncbi:MAG: thiamine phosphate synthase [Myxococcales bacterium]